MILETQIVIRLLVAALLGSLIGFERERLLWAAGIRTHMLVSVGACLFMIVSAYGFQQPTTLPNVVLDPSRVAAQVVSGIGFLGAGSILLRGQTVRGMTTAASIWAVAAIGLASGGGLYFAAAASTIVILVILAGVKPLEEAYRARIQSCVVRVQAERDALSADELPKALGVRGSQIKRVTTAHASSETDELRIDLVRVSAADMRATGERLRALPGVLLVEVAKKHGAGKNGASGND